ncbi:MAG: hypothetical protein R3B06_29080 [Kofleriaceae bacterium]
MTTTRLDDIVRRQRSRTTRDLVAGITLAVLVMLGLGAVLSSARGASFAPAPAAAPLTR